MQTDLGVLSNILTSDRSSPRNCSSAALKVDWRYKINRLQTFTYGERKWQSATQWESLALPAVLDNDLTSNSFSRTRQAWPQNSMSVFERIEYSQHLKALRNPKPHWEQKLQKFTGSDVGAKCPNLHMSLGLSLAKHPYKIPGKYFIALQNNQFGLTTEYPAPEIYSLCIRIRGYAVELDHPSPRFFEVCGWVDTRIRSWPQLWTIVAATLCLFFITFLVPMTSWVKVSFQIDILSHRCYRRPSNSYFRY